MKPNYWETNWFLGDFDRTLPVKFDRYSGIFPTSQTSESTASLSSTE
ncbi:hypothetical protein [Microcoleus anatoxicus]|uniref:Uncharacterized protein n=1 Tax=Microcoleus anatoxicus PTRS2 TaxID=2705321 RepID=A0ABU8YIL2_9CYAN